MHGDFSRWTFDPRERYRAVLLQQGRVLLDADWNEQAQITAYHDEIRTRDLLGWSGGPDEGGGFEIVDAAGKPPEKTAWTDLRITPGRYYVDGVLVEAHGTEPIPLAGRPDRPGPPEPAEPGRYVLYLDVWTHQVTMDEEPKLREPALGGPDTTTRARTVWRIGAGILPAGTVCADLRPPAWPGGLPGKLAVTLGEASEDADPCQISDSGGYTRLENQLYRVQIHDVPEGGKTRYLWSRENGSVTAGLDTVNHLADGTSELIVDRAGRDEELSIRKGDVVEVTNTDLQLRGEPGYLAEVGVPRGLTLPVTWLDAPAPTDLGDTAIVRRWESSPREIHGTAVELENNIQVAFTDGDFRPGDYWLIPARSVRLAYGIADAQGTVEWPLGKALPPFGPLRRIAPLSIVERVDGGWKRVSDCRPIAPSLTQLTTIDLIGGDGQEALPGQRLPEPIRVVVRNGGLPVEHARVEFKADAGSVTDGNTTGTVIVVRTGPDGVAAVLWTPAADGETTQTLTAQRLDDHETGIDVKVIVTARVCRPQLRLAGGDGQHLPSNRLMLPEQIRVIVDSPLGPVAGAKVTAEGSAGALVRRGQPGEQRPGGLPGASNTEDTETDAEGRAAFWWQPSFDDVGSDVLTIRLTGGLNTAPLTVTAQRAPQSGRTPGVHIKELLIGDGRKFLNDDKVSAAELDQGIQVYLDGDVVQDSVRGKPVVRVLLDLPWPFPSEVFPWPDMPPVGFRSIELDADWNADNGLITWGPATRTRQWLTKELFPGLKEKLGWQQPLIGRFILDSWAIISQKDSALHVNGHVDTFFGDDGRTLFKLPTDDEVTGGQFVQWFRLIE